MKNLTKAMMIIVIISLLFSCTRKINIAKENIEEYNNFNSKLNVFDSPNKDFLDSIIGKIYEVLSDDWFVIKVENGFEVIYCKSCQEKYLLKKDSTPFREKLLVDRMEYFNENGTVSVCYYSGISTEYKVLKSKKDFLDNYPVNNILKIKILFESKWSNEKYQIVLNKNDSLNKKIQKELHAKSFLSISPDYRFCLPNENTYISYLNNIEAKFKRLPYISFWIEKSVFIVSDKPFCFAEIFNINDKNIAKKRNRAINSIAYALGINDFSLINE